MERPWRRGGGLLAVALMAAAMSASVLSGEAKLSPGYYRSTCPRVESIVRSAVARKVRETFVTVPATLRLFFHDCFVQVRAGEIERSTPLLLPLNSDFP
jgi:peroxidase